jgi:hypothetical protein
MKLMTACLVIGALAASAHAGPAERADQLFKRGKRLLAQKKYPEACAAFEDSDRLDPGIGAKLNVAKCYQDWGKLATAWRWYVDAETMATSARDDRARKIRALVDELDPDVPRLTVKPPRDANLAGVVIKLDGVVLQPSALGVEQRVDPGPHDVDTIIGGVRRTRVVLVERRGHAEVVLELPAATVAKREPDSTGVRPGPGASPGPAPVATVEATAGATGGAPGTDNPGRTRRFIGLGVAGAGAITIAISGIVTLGARGDYRNALDDHCQGKTDLCDEDGLSITHSALRRANVATVFALIGLGAVATGAVVYFTAPKASRPGEHAYYLAPSVGPDGGTLVFGGAF